MNEIELLDEFRQRRSESAFSDLVRRYTNLVYSAAVRRLSSPSLAQEAAQNVFIRLARNPPKLRTEAELAGWLHRTTVHVAIDLWRSETRRRAREEHAATMETTPLPDSTWKEIAPALDEALNELNDPDRQALLLRYFHDQSMRDLGRALGISEDAAKMRVSRALDRLRVQLSARGVACGTAALGALLAAHALEAAPAEIAAALAKVPYPVAELAAGDTAGLGASGSGLLAKVAGGMAALGLAGALTWMAVDRSANKLTSGSRAATGSAADQAASSHPVVTAASAAAQASVNQPDPVQLLQNVVRARQRLTSGTVDFDVQTITRQQTNQVRLSASFLGGQRRVEQFGREYAYLYDEDPVRAEELRARADAYGPDREAAVEAGLLTGFEAHYVTILDGTSLMQYRDTDGTSGSATIDDPAKGASAFAFDPRALGLYPSLYPTVESWSELTASKSFELVGQAEVDGVPAWHLRASSADALELWLDVAVPNRVLKAQTQSAVVLSRYDSAAPESVLPTELILTYFRSGMVSDSTRLLRTSLRLDKPVEPASFTLAGLGMKIGTPVSDIRIHRGIGYWTGDGLSEHLPRKTTALPDETSPRAEMLSILEHSHPGSPAAFEAAEWILLNTPDGVEVEKAAAVMIDYHLTSPDLVRLCQQMERMRHRCANEFLQAVLKSNSEPTVRAAACYTLATLRKDECQYGADKKLTVEAEQYFERVISEARQAGPNHAHLVSKATEELSALRKMTIGKPAPDLEGTDLQGRRFRLSEQRGKVVLVVFFDSVTADGPAEQIQVLEPFTNQPVVWIGITDDESPEKTAVTLEKRRIPWPVIWDGRHGPIHTAWQVHSWPSVFVLDRNGVIRARNARGPALAEAVRAALAQ